MFQPSLTAIYAIIRAEFASLTSLGTVYQFRWFDATITLCYLVPMLSTFRTTHFKPTLSTIHPS